MEQYQTRKAFCLAPGLRGTATKSGHLQRRTVCDRYAVHVKRIVTSGIESTRDDVGPVSSVRVKRQALLKLSRFNSVCLQSFFLPPYNMDTLDNTEWDVVIAGTGLPQSLLAL